MRRSSLLPLPFLLTLMHLTRPLAAGDGGGAAVRSRRYLLYPPKGTSVAQLITGFGIPVMLENHAITLGIVIKYNYPLPQNSTELLQPYVQFQRAAQPAPSRWEVYDGIEAAVGRLGLGLSGRRCLLRAVCESAATPFDPGAGLAAEMLHILLTPSTSGEPPGAGREYVEAEERGREGGAPACGPLEQACPLPLLQLVSRITGY